MKKALVIITIAIGVALVALLAYSIERSAWLLSLYEAVAVEGENTSGPALAMAAALVAELGAIALIVGEAAIGLVGNKDTAKRLARWAGFGLLLVLSLQSVAGLVAGYTRGGDRMLAELGAGSNRARFWVAAVALLLGNLTVPGLILALSKIAAILVGQLVLLPAASGATIPLAMPSYAYARPAEIPIATRICATCGASQAGEVCDKCGMVEMPEMPIAEGIKCPAYACPQCHQELTPAQYGAAKRWGACKTCRTNKGA